MESFALSHTENYPLLRCKNCDMSFILVYATAGVNDNGEPTKTVMKQAKCDYCPYCGAAQFEKERM